MLTATSNIRVLLRKIKNAYKTTFWSFILLIIFSQLFTYFLSRNLEQYNNSVKLAIAQKALSQQLVQLSLRLDKPGVKERLDAQNRSFLLYQRALQYGDDSLHIPIQTQKSILLLFEEVSESFIEISENIESLVSTGATNTQNNVEEIAKNETVYLSKMSEIIREMERIHHRKLLFFRYSELSVAFFVIVAIGVTVFFLLRPTFNRIESERNRLLEVQLILEKVENTILVMNQAGKTTWVNDAFTRLTGYKAEDIIGKNYAELLYGELTSKETIDQITYGLTMKAPFYVEILNYHRLGLPFWVNLQFTPVLNGKGEVEKTIAVLSDITERKNAEERIIKTSKELEIRNEEVRKAVRETTALADKLQKGNTKLEAQRIVLEKQNKKIRDSINYAKRIQTALSSDRYILEKYFADFFIFNQPKDVVSGDFLWCSKTGNKLFLVVADCTGHGVPGAIMSTIGINLLDKITGAHKLEKPNVILQALQHELKKMLKTHTEENVQVNDGMDIGIVTIDMVKNMLYFAGAFHNFYYTHRDAPEKLHVVRGDRIGIGGIYGKKLHPFKIHEFKFSTIKRFFIFTDGVKDQFGNETSPIPNAEGERDKKFTQKRILDVLNTHSNEKIGKIGAEITRKIAAWKGERNQTDDMLMIGVETRTG